ncbi:DNA-deoxyinosine glycosylase [Treponema sp. Marseille-Q4523]|uniref:DNA-deoxyinosine glycosylase n=1 Tax=Treponema sp. Marseille-Q4523 TaxID=2810610 RepID=UPI001961A08B|nr:DNA-deoxyinosine glycosylase [Treponema sp. Marseille-Q4523]MBM7022073.1 DNA-deoxyinosine glycosylase [Treponema sp. Marseille-Q4523]
MRTVNPPSASRIDHPFAPVYDSESRVLVLGTMPSPRSRTAGFYYMHEQNRFWPVIASLTGERLDYANDAGSKAVDERRALVLRHGIALWDVLASCDIRGAADTSIKNPVPNDFSKLLVSSHIDRIYCTGQTAYKLYTKLCEEATHIGAVCLPSTSSANCGRWPLDALIEAYRCVFER